MQKASSWATVWPPITLALLGTLAEKWGPVRLLDGDVESMTMEELIADLRAFGPDLVVVNTGFPSIDSDMAIAKRIKDVFPEIRVAAFGVYFTMLEKQAFENYPFLDFCIVGEPEMTFDELLESLHEPLFQAGVGLVDRRSPVGDQRDPGRIHDSHALGDRETLCPGEYPNYRTFRHQHLFVPARTADHLFIDLCGATRPDQDAGVADLTLRF